MMTTESENEVFTPEEQEWINFVRYQYVKMYLPWLLRPGVTFTPEQQAKIKELVANRDLAAAQKIVLDQLKDEMK